VLSVIACTQKEDVTIYPVPGKEVLQDISLYEEGDEELNGHIASSF
jgi:hypothetical protein